MSLRYFLGKRGDPNGTFCSFSTVGAPLNQGFYGIPFNRRISSDQLDALNALVSLACPLRFFTIR